MNQDALKFVTIKSTAKIFDKERDNFSKKPFLHVYIDSFFISSFKEKLLNSFHNLDSEEWECPTDQVTVNEPHKALWKKKASLDKRGNKTRDFS